MPHSNKKFFYHLLAIATAGIWGTTFVATKTLLLVGLTPAEIFIYRFSLAYLCIIFIAGRQVFAKSWLDEIKMIAAGLTGGSVYFTTENTALEFTQASNVGILISITPLLTTLLGMAIYKSERTKRPWRIVAGSSIALIGVAAIVLNGNTEMHFNLKGDLLTLAAALSWAFYSLIVKNLSRRYPVAFISRKVFGYGLLSMAVWMPFSHPASFHLSALSDLDVLLNLLFLGVIASMGCYTAWNVVVRKIGMVKATNYINLNPIVTFIAAFLILDERITTVALVGSAAVIFGVCLAEKSK